MLLLIPLIGTTYTFLVFSLVLIIVALIGLWSTAGLKGVFPLSWMPVVLVVLAVFLANQPFKRTTGQVFETETAYNYIEILREGDFTFLRLNEGQGVHSIYHPDQLAYYGSWMQFLVAPFFYNNFKPEQVERIAIIGLAGGTTSRQATAVFGPISIDGYEIDPGIIEVGRTYFDMNQPNLNAIAQDGRWGLTKSPYRYTFIGIDAFRPPYIPWHLTTQEYFQSVRDHLIESGSLVINVGRAPERSSVDQCISWDDSYDIPFGLRHRCSRYI